MSLTTKYEQIENYLNNRLTIQENTDFEAKMQQNPDFLTEVNEHRSFMESLQMYGNRKKIKLQLESFHATMEKPTVMFYKTKNIKNFFQKHLPTIAVAASVAVFTVFGVLWNNNHFNTLEDQQIGYYKSLKKDIEKVKKTQADLVEQTKDINEPKKINYTATAFLISSNGFLITNRHTIDKNNVMYVEAKIDGIAGKKDSVLRLKVAVFYEDKIQDLAILKVVEDNFKGFGKLPYALRSDVADLGEEVFTLAYPHEDMVYGEGSVSSKSGFEGDSVAYQISIPVNPGNSGSPLLDEKGNLIGIITGKNTNEDGAAFAIKSQYVRAIIDSISKNHPESNIQLPVYNQLQYLKRPQQIKKLKDCVFELKVYSSK